MPMERYLRNMFNLSAGLAETSIAATLTLWEDQPCATSDRYLGSKATE